VAYREQPTRPELVGSFGMVASTHWLASACGMSVLERGGNAMDAAVAAGFVLQVVEPHLNGPAGEVPVLLWSATDQAAHVVCGQGVAPAAATSERFSELGLSAVPGTGLLAATVPGAFGGWMALLERWGTWRLHDVLDCAIGYSSTGYPALRQIVQTVESVRELFTAEWPTSAQSWLTDAGTAPAPGSRLTNAALATTYHRLIEEAEQPGLTREAEIRRAVDVWYSGFVAEEIDRFCSSTSWADTSGRRHGGLLTAADMTAWSAQTEAPASYAYGPYTVCKTAPWGQGPVLLQQLALLSGFDLDRADLQSAEFIHLVTECAKLAFADREAWYGESAPPGLLEHVLSQSYNDERRGLIGEGSSGELRPGDLPGRRPVLPGSAGSGPSAGVGASAGAATGPSVAAGLGEPTGRGMGAMRGDTCHVDVVDRHGNMVSATPSGGWLQSSPTIPQLGFCLGTRAQMFWLEPGLPNSLTPGARPRTTLSPSLVFRDAEPWLAFGTPGGDQQDQWGLVFLLGVIHGRLGLQDAIDAPTFHSEHFPSSFYPRDAHPRRLVAESRIDPDAYAALGRKGHDVVPAGPWSLGRLSAVAREGGFLKAAANARGSQGYAAGR